MHDNLTLGTFYEELLYSCLWAGNNNPSAMHFLLDRNCACATQKKLPSYLEKALRDIALLLCSHLLSTVLIVYVREITSTGTARRARGTPTMIIILVPVQICLMPAGHRGAVRFTASGS